MKPLKNIIELETLMNEATELKIPLYVKWSADWCQPCKKIQPVFEQLQDKFNNQALFCCLKLDCKEFRTLATNKNVRQLPTFWKLENKKLVDLFIGSDPKELTRFISANLKEPAESSA